MQGSGHGRGAYYKAKYGDRGRSQQSEHPVANEDDGDNSLTSNIRPVTVEWNALATDLYQMDRQDYGAYKRLLHKVYRYSEHFKVQFVYIQGDPYAPPSRLRVIKKLSGTGLTDVAERPRRIATADYITRLAAEYLRAKGLNKGAAPSSGWSGPKGGAFNINAPGQEVLERTSCIIEPNAGLIEMRLTVALPAAGRTVTPDMAWKMLGQNLAGLIKYCLEVDTTAQHGEFHAYFF